MRGPRLTMRAVVERNMATGLDEYNHPLPPSWELFKTIPCFAWSVSEQFVQDVGKTAILEVIRMMVDLDSGIEEHDRVTAIYDRGRNVYPYEMEVQTRQYKHSHYECVLEKIS
jgi:hypothetical protein